MSPLYATPGVYIEEITGPGVIAGVGTSTAAFIGPAVRGPFVPTTITTFDDFKRIYGRETDGWPYLFATNRWYYLGHAVQGFFENGGARAVILRVGTAKAATWSLKNQKGQVVLKLEARQEGSRGNGLSVDVQETGLRVPSVQGKPEAPKFAYAEADILAVVDKTLEISYAGNDRFVPGDTVLLAAPGGTKTDGAVVISVDAGGTSIVLDHKWPHTLPADPLPTSIKIADIIPTQARFRLAKLEGIQPGSLIRVTSAGTPGSPHHAVVGATDVNGFVYLRQPLFQSAIAAGTWLSTIPIRSGTAAAQVETIEFSLTIKDSAQGGQIVDEVEGLSLDPFHSGYIDRVELKSVRVLPSVPAPATGPAQNVLLRDLAMDPAATATVKTNGQDDDLSKLDLKPYKDALAALEDVDEVSIVCIPDSANDPSIQQAVFEHCVFMKDRIAVLDVPFGREPDGPDSAKTHRASVEATGGFAALYYPWLTVPEPVEPALPRPAIPRPLPIPPSGHIAGIMARTDETLGVHHAPANTEVRGVMGLERVLSDRQQALINLEGVNALRIFPGEGRVIVWGARTTAPKTETDWTYVNVRRLMLYIEESIEEGIRWAVFKPNDRPLWQSLKRTIDDFLESVWRAGGLAGLKREQAYQVRIDEGLNPYTEIVLGRLHIEIKVAPVRPAEFIIVRIGLWDGGAVITES